MVDMIHEDEFLKQLKADLVDRKHCPKGYELVHDIVRYKERSVVPCNSRLVAILLQEYHNSFIGDTTRKYNTYQHLTENGIGLA